ncbi:MAG: PEP-CTERM sorting domain-containing protein [Verrucomicrobiota bacterium]
MKKVTAFLMITTFLAVTMLSNAQIVGLNNWVESGGDADNVFIGNGTAGFSQSVTTETDGNFAIGAFASFTSDVTLGVNETLQMDLTVSSITINNAQNNVGFRIGFENDNTGSDDDATLHYLLSTGGGVIGRFAGNSNQANEFSSGTAFDSINYTGATSIDTGNTVNISVGLTNLGETGVGTGIYNYSASINWDGISNTNVTPFTRNTNVWDKVYVLTNAGTSFGIDGDAYTVSGVQVQVVPEPSTFALLGLGMGALCLVRRRR